MLGFRSVVSVGMASIATMPISLICASIFSEVAWARCWASASDGVLKRGALYGTIQVSSLLPSTCSVQTAPWLTFNGVPSKRTTSVTPLRQILEES